VRDLSASVLVPRRRTEPVLRARVQVQEVEAAEGDQERVTKSQTAPLPEVVDLPDNPAKFSESILDAIASVTRRRIPDGARVLDPFAGTGRIHRFTRWDTVGVEIEPEWVAWHPRTILGDATQLDFPDGSFHSAITSPTYGTRMADHHNAVENCKACGGKGKVARKRCEKCNGFGRREYKRNTYRHTLNRRDSKTGEQLDLNERNTGRMQFYGPDAKGSIPYMEMHEAAWEEVHRVVQKYLVLNISDHWRAGRIVKTTDWHLEVLRKIGFNERARIDVPTPRNGNGQNRDKRVPFEHVIVLGRVKRPKK
jgi:hypothetical protein